MSLRAYISERKPWALFRKKGGRTPDETSMKQTDSAPKILFVDDDPQILVVLKAHFVENYQVFTAASAAEAITLANQHTFSVVISDYCMPQQRGDKLLGYFFQTYPETTRVMMSGFSDMEMLAAAVNDGHVFGYILKPPKLAAIRDVIERSIQYHRAAVQKRDLALEIETANERLSEELERCRVRNDLKIAAVQHRLARVVQGSLIADSDALPQITDILPIVANEIARARSSDSELTAAAITVERFPEENCQCALQTVAAHLHSCCRPFDLLAQSGLHQLLLVRPGTNLTKLKAFAAEIEAKLSGYGLTFGYAELGEHELAEDWMRRAMTESYKESRSANRQIR